ncbi:hypothetical protein PG990_015003 [Apiospora arundinis]
MSIGRIQAGIAQASQELTVTAANFNFDFTLMKFEAPAEYQMIGTVLTPTRIREAEDGPIHVTARKLGALFEGACPDTPNLIKAYGTRASEISKEVSEADSNSPGSVRNWIRTEYGGIDATSIWAAATSSKAALPVHLLACIIARMWTRTEAVSVWAEIVAERKKEIVATFDEGVQVPLALASAAQQELTRDHLGIWDASARAWLQTADNSRQRQYKQFLLIANNLSIAIHQHSISLYKDVMNVWASALTATEGLISGKPHAVQNGPVLLGLSAWHIFPDMLVCNGPTANIHIPMSDPLVKPGGVLSLGISDPAHREKQGVYWSLSLSQHMFYGEAVQRTRRLNVDGSRLTLHELFLVCFGSLLRRWSIPKSGIDKAFKILQEIKRVMPQERNKREEWDWREVVEQLLQAYAAGDKKATLAVSLGRRRPTFLSAQLTAKRKSLFGLLNIPHLLFLLKEPERKISLLRRLATRVRGLSNDNSIILYFNKLLDDGGAQFATTFPKMGEGGHSPSRNSRSNNYHRWIQVPEHIRNDFAETIRSGMGFEYFLGAEERFPDTGLIQIAQQAPPETNVLDNFERHDDSISPHLSLRGGSGGSKTRAIDGADSEDSIDSEGNTDSDTFQSRAIWREVQHSMYLPTTDLFAEHHGFSMDVEHALYEDHEEPDIGDSSDTKPRLLRPFPKYSNPSDMEETVDSQDDHQSAMQQSFTDIKKASEKVYVERCAGYLTERERKIRPETIEYLRPGKLETVNNYVNSSRSNFYQDFVDVDGDPWCYHGRSDQIILEGQRRDTYRFLFGQRTGDFSLQSDSLPDQEHARAAIYLSHRNTLGEAPDLPAITLDDVLWSFEHDLVDPTRLKTLLESEPAFAFLRVLAAVNEVYREPAAGGATISGSIIDKTFDPPVFSKTLGEDDWADASACLSINQKTGIALIGYFETANNFIDNMKGDYNIIGLSGGDSIFVRTAILNDPGAIYPEYSFTRILGNIGKSGLSIMTSPSTLMARKLDPSAWRVDTVPFNGAPLDSFSRTSLHLSLTDWQAPLVQYQSVGQREADANIVEAVVSVRDAGMWVADVDISRALLSDRLVLPAGGKRGKKRCEHCFDDEHMGGESRSDFSGGEEELISIETWDQVLDDIDGAAVVRCYGNPIARLATMSVLCQHSKAAFRPVIICSETACWKCHAKGENHEDKIYIY